MNKINLEDAKIYFEEEWLSADDITNRIQNKMHSGEMKFANLAAALEELNGALENVHKLKVNLTLTKNEYEKLLKRGKADDKECIYKAIRFYVGKGIAPLPSSGASETGQKKYRKKMTIKCANCGSPIKVRVDQENDEIRCAKCGARGLLKPLK